MRFPNTSNCEHSQNFRAFSNPASSAPFFQNKHPKHCVAHIELRRFLAKDLNPIGVSVSGGKTQPIDRSEDFQLKEIDVLIVEGIACNRRLQKKLVGDLAENDELFCHVFRSEM
jgi:tRNA A37 threonylcarbamoyltransferase TsaD